MLHVSPEVAVPVTSDRLWEAVYETTWHSFSLQNRNLLLPSQGILPALWSTFGRRALHMFLALASPASAAQRPPVLLTHWLSFYPWSCTWQYKPDAQWRALLPTWFSLWCHVVGTLFVLPRTGYGASWQEATCPGQATVGSVPPVSLDTIRLWLGSEMAVLTSRIIM